jgi:ribonucleoside-diphosphate reductase beta chain
LPLRLFEKGKRRGIWNPSDIDLSQDSSDWQKLTLEEQDLLLRLSALFLGGEESVTLDLLPLIETVASEGRLEEELYLASFLFEEAKHVDFFRRVFDEVFKVQEDLSRYLGPSYLRLIQEELPGALQRLRYDRSMEAQVRASVTYNLIVEGILAETGYHGFFTVLNQRGILPGVRLGISRLQDDEARHIAFGIHFLSRWIQTSGQSAWQAVEQRFQELLPLALGVVSEIFAPYPVIPFSLTPEHFLNYAMAQSSRRILRLERVALGESPEIEGESGT